MRKLLPTLPVTFLFALGMLLLPSPASAGNVCAPGAKRCVDGYKHVCAGGKRWQKTSDKCGQPVQKCAKLLMHCSAGSQLLTTVCGGQPHTLSSHVSKNISYVEFSGATKGAVLTRCGTNETLTIRANTNLCSLRGGCCDTKTRWNDTICKIKLF